MGVETTHAPRRAGEVDRSCVSVERVRALLAWQARTQLHDGIDRMVPA